MNDNHVGPAYPWVAVCMIAIVVRKEYDPLKVGQLGQNLKCGRADVAIAFCPLVAPGCISDTRQCQEQADERDGIASDLTANICHGRLDPNPPAHRNSSQRSCRKTGHARNLLQVPGLPASARCAPGGTAKFAPLWELERGTSEKPGCVRTFPRRCPPTSSVAWRPRASSCPRRRH